MNWKRLSRRDVVVGSVALAACGPAVIEEGWPFAQWPEEEMNPSAIPQNAPLARPGQSSLYDPLVLYAETDLTPGAALSPNTAALVNPHAMPMELLGVKFRIHTLNGATGLTPPAAESVSGLGIGVKMDMGSLQLVDANTPVSLFSNARDDGEDSTLGYLAFTTTDQTTLTGPTAQVYDYLWRFKYPMYIPPSAVVTPLFSHLTQTPFNVRVGVSYYCRTWRQSRKEPTEVWAPWVSKYISKSFNINTGTNVADSDESSELDIRSPFSTGRVELQRITGRVNYYVSGDNGAAPNSNWERGYGDQIYQYLRLTMRGSRGDEIIRTPTMFGSVFGQQFKSWELGPCWYMYPGEFYDVRLTRDAFTGPSDAANSARMQVGIGVVGFQKINTKTLEGAL